MSHDGEERVPRPARQWTPEDLSATAGGSCPVEGRLEDRRGVLVNCDRAQAHEGPHYDFVEELAWELVP